MRLNWIENVIHKDRVGEYRIIETLAIPWILVHTLAKCPNTSLEDE